MLRRVALWLSTQQQKTPHGASLAGFFVVDFCYCLDSCLRSIYGGYSHIRAYISEGGRNLCVGPHLPHTGRITAELRGFSRVFQKRFLLTIGASL